MEKIFEIDRLDHVAITVNDMEASIKWYEKVLGLKSYKLPKWGEYPVFLLSGKAGIALFPSVNEHHEIQTNASNVKIDHFAFHVNQQNLKKAIAHYKSLNLEYRFKDHYYYHSVYTNDLDGHTVELTSLIEENSFFN